MKFERGETSKVEIKPGDFPELIGYDQLVDVMDYQREAFEAGTFEHNPLPETENEKLQQAFEAFSENRELYDDEIDEAIEADDIIRSIRPGNREAVTPEKARLIRIRSSVVAAQKVLIKQYVTVAPEAEQATNETAGADSRVA